MIDTAKLREKLRHAAAVSTASADNENYQCCCLTIGEATAILAALERGETSDAIDLIASERRRQISMEGYSSDHDDKHKAGCLAVAAACYAMPEHRRRMKTVGISARSSKDVPEEWFWEPHFWKPTPRDRIRELAKAGALIVAEIDRLQRAALSPSAGEGAKP